MLNILISIVSVILAMLSVIITYYIYKASRSDNSYPDIDKQYSDLLRIGLDEPDLRSYEHTSMFYKLDSNNTYKKKYNIYANMCWNLVETIYDRQKDKGGRFKLSETWIPVMFEENRLHYTWFKHNLRLFKPDFQKFVTSELNDIEIIEGSVSDLRDVYERFEKDFPGSEKKDYAHLKILMEKGKYKLLLAKHKIFGGIIGYAFIYEIDNNKMLWLDYMAIDMRFQNAGYGTLLFNKITESKQDGILGIFLEVEIPSEGDDQCRLEQQRRIKFYERMEAERLSVDYKLPNNEGGLPMYLYFRPSSSLKLLPKEQIRETISSAFEYIHFDISKRNEIFEGIKNTIKDKNFN